MFDKNMEELAFACLRQGRQFAKSVDAAEVPINSDLVNRYCQLLGQLSDGQILCIKEFETLVEIGAAIREELNSLVPGYGDRVFSQCTADDQIIIPEQRLLRDAAVQYQNLMNEHSVIQDRLTAMRWMWYKERQARTGHGA